MFIPQKYRYVFVTFPRDVHDYAGRIPLLRERQGGFAVAPLTPSQSPLLQVFCFVAGDFASADATKGLCGRPLETFASRFALKPSRLHSVRQGDDDADVDAAVLLLGRFRVHHFHVRLP